MIIATVVMVYVMCILVIAAGILIFSAGMGDRDALSSAIGASLVVFAIVLIVFQSVVLPAIV